MPVFKAALPLSAADAAALLELLGVQELSSPDLREVSVRKRRAHYTFGGCMAELTEMRTKEGAIRTIAVESEDPSASATVRELGLEDAPAVCLARGLKALTGWARAAPR